MSAPVSPPPRRLAWAVWLLAFFLWFAATMAFAWPVYRAFLNVQIDSNEAWNAWYADAAMGRAPLYPAPEQLITNNYPPLSFYIVGGLGRLLGDPVLAGRLLSLGAVIGIAVAIALSIRRLEGSRLGASLGAAFFVITISRFCDRYVGMNDPQLLGQVVMAFGFAGFLGAVRRDRGWAGPILLMACAGFIKHNIIAMPATAFLWLATHRPREAAKWFGLALLAIAAGFALCVALYGRNFLFNMTSPRAFSWAVAWHSIGLLKCVDVAVAALLLVFCFRRRDPHFQISALFIFLGAAVYVLQKTGAGVDLNAMFDLLIAASIGLGLAFTHVASLPFPKAFTPELLRTILLAALLLRAVPAKRYPSLPIARLLFDRTFQSEIALRERAMAESTAAVRAVPGDVIASHLAGYRSGKPYVVDKFNADQRIDKGALPRDAILSRRASGELTKVDLDPRADWDLPIEGRK